MLFEFIYLLFLLLNTESEHIKSSPHGLIIIKYVLKQIQADLEILRKYVLAWKLEEPYFANFTSLLLNI